MPPGLGNGAKKLIGGGIVLAAAGAAIAGASSRQIGGPAPIMPTASAVNYNTPQLVPLSYPPPPQPTYFQDFGGAGAQTVPVITGIQNVMNKWGAIPRVFGRYRVFPPLAGQFVPVSSGNSGWALGLFLVGYGPLQIDSLKIGDADISTFGADVVYQVLPGDNPLTEKITIYSTDFKDLPLAESLKYNVASLHTAPQASVELAVDVSFPNGLYTADAAGNRTPATVNFNVEYRVSGAAGTNVTATNNPGAGSNVLITMTNTAAVVAGQWVTVSSGATSEMALITNVINNVSITVASLANSYTHPNVNLGSWQRVPPPLGLTSDPSITATDNSPIVVTRTLTWTAAKATYEVRVTRLTADSTSTLLVNASNLTNIRATGDTPVVKPFYDANGNIIPMAYIAVKFRADSSLNGVIQQFNCVATSKLATWDGAHWTAPVVTRNPAWAYAEMLCGNANPRPLDRTKLNGNDLKAWADYCDTKSRTFNYVYDTDTTVPQVLRDCASAGRASVHVRDGLYTVIQDIQRTAVVQHITPRNVIKGTHKQKLTLIDRPHFLKVQFVDPNSNWQQVERDVYDDGYSADGSNGTTVGRTWEKLPLLGCTSADQAFREARYRHSLTKLRIRTFTFQMDWENLACDRGDMVRYSYDTSLIGLGQAVITQVITDGSGNVTSVVIDDAQTMDATHSYGVRIRCANWTDTLQAAVNTVVGATNLLTFSTPILSGAAVKPEVGDLLMFGYASAESIELIIQSITYHPDFAAEITAVDHAPGVFVSETEAIPAYSSGITTRPVIQTSVTAPTITAIRSDESVLIQNSDGTLTTRILLTMAPTGQDIVSFEPQFKRTDAQTWTSLPLVPVAQGEVSIVGVTDGVTYDVRIRSRNGSNYVSAWTPIQHYVIGKTTPPPALDFLDRNGNLLLFRVTNPPKDYAGVRIWANIGQNTNVASATVVAALVTDTQWDMTPLQGGPMTIMAATVDVAGNVGTVSVLLKDFGSDPTANILVTHSEAPAFTGVISGGTIISSVLTANDDGGVFWGGNDAQLFWGGNDTDLFWNSSFSTLTYDFKWTPDASLGKGFSIALATNIQGEAYTVQYRGAGNNLFWDDVDASMFWTGNNSDLFWGPDDALQTWPGKIDGSLQTYEFLITCPASGIKQGKISQLDVVVDVPSISEDVNDFVFDASTGAVRLPVTKAYRVITGVQLTLEQNLSLYPNAKNIYLIDKSIGGPQVLITDASGAAAKGKMDATVKGY